METQNPLVAILEAWVDKETDITPKHVTTLLYKARTGETKELRIVQPVEPGTIRLTTEDIQLLGREIAKVLREDS